ncbi:hypothetical protein ACQJ0K_17175 [Priestia megaterium]|uniref:hypothetical protein n=1 Tax=Priestia megaterium TaxID=1404 RepID=UPI003CFB905F
MYDLNASSDAYEVNYSTKDSLFALLTLYKLYVKQHALILMETCHKSCFFKNEESAYENKERKKLKNIKINCCKI